MKNRAYLLSALMTIVVAFVGLSLMFSAPGAAQVRDRGGDSVAVCDLLDVFANYDRRADMTEEFKQRGDDIVQERETRIARLEAMRGELNALTIGSDDYDAMMEKIEREAVETQTWYQIKMGKAARDHHRVTTEMYEDILKIVQVVADERGYKIVLFRESRDTQTENVEQLMAQIQNRKVLYHTAGVDISQAVLARLNHEYKARSR
ncbi:hypothetical protein LCGC14_0203400 [marine sediment metagenome]|uniref:OmpH family outer membrane protein n=1 Tax=marine sediment metagenome TaxID=412755 RepID=A0A0F9XL36_9ZZZZ|nr:OmpH family outer membrane protein [Phycisphaerae bacterium]HDZ42886.1 OmpH family outer membrane protein [Phycisphaerae bacterium]